LTALEERIKKVLDEQCPDYELMNSVVPNVEEVLNILKQHGCKVNCWTCYRNEELAVRLAEEVRTK